MNLTLPEKAKINKKQLIIYISIIVFCIISLVAASYVQFYARIDFAEMIGIKQREEFGNKSQEQIQTLKADFDKIFSN